MTSDIIGKHWNRHVRIGWTYQLAHVSAVFLLTGGIGFLGKLNPPPVATAASEGIGMLTWLAQHSMDRSLLVDQAAWTLALAPLCLLSWHHFALDAAPRRPEPKLWHTLPPALLLAALYFLFRHQPIDTEKILQFRSTIPRLLSGSHAGICFFFSQTMWLASGFAYFIVLPLAEIFGYRTRSHAI